MDIARSQGGCVWVVAVSLLQAPGLQQKQNVPGMYFGGCMAQSITTSTAPSKHYAGDE